MQEGDWCHYRTFGTGDYEGPYKTRDEAVKAAIPDRGLEAGEDFFVGKVHDGKPRVNVQAFIDSVEETTAEEVGVSEEPWPPRPTDEMRAFLKVELHGVWARLQEKYPGFKPDWFEVEEVAQYRVAAESGGDLYAVFVAEIEKS